MLELIGLILIGLLIYFFPTLMANSRSKNNFAGIFILNLFLGWTFVGWVVALIWASLKDDKA